MLGIFLKLFVLMLCAILCDCGDTYTKDTCKSFQLNKKNLNKRLIGYGILEPDVNGHHDCVRHCFNFKSCKSFDFHRKGRSCKLNNVTGDSPEAVFEDKAGSIFSDITKWPGNMAGKCGERPCSERQRCINYKDSYKCRDIICGNLPVLPNGVATPDDKNQKSYLDTATVECDVGYLANKRSIQCQVSGEWESSTCERIACGNLPVLPKGVATLDVENQKSYLDTATVECVVGYLANKHSIQCQASGEWESSTCDDVDDCHISPCGNGGSCVDMLNGYTCTCASGYTGTHCEQDCYATTPSDYIGKRNWTMTGTPVAEKIRSLVFDNRSRNILGLLWY